VKAALPGFRGQVILGDVSLGWLAPIRIRQVVVNDEHGAPLCEAAEAATTKSLLTLLLNSSNLGEIQITQPTVYAVVRPDGSNLEDSIAPLLEGESSGGVTCTLRVVDGKCLLRDDATQHEALLQQIAATIQISADVAEPYQVQLATIVSSEPLTGELQLSGEWRAGEMSSGENVQAVGKFTLNSQSVPLAALIPFFTRCGVRANLAGHANLKISANLDEGGTGSLKIEECVVEQLDAQFPEHLGSDRVQFEQLNASGEAGWTGDTVTLQNMSLSCDVGRVQASGAAPKAALSSRQFLSAAREVTFDGQGELDLAQLARLLPQTLKLREGLTVTSGVIRLTCATRDEEQTRKWEGRLETSGLAAIHQGRPITWDRPLTATFALRDTADGPALDQLACESDFFQATGAGSFHEGNLALQADLSKLAAELQRFVDLGAMQFGGSVEGQARWRRDERELVGCDGHLRLANFTWAAPNRRPWREPELTATFAAAGVLDQDGLRRLEQASVEVKAGEDAALVRLTAPVENMNAATAWPVHCEARGDLASWAPRLENFIALPAGALEGRASLSAQGAVGSNQADFATATALIESLYFQGSGLTVRESRVEAQGDVAWNGASQTIAMKQATFASSAVAFRAQKVAMNLANDAFAAAGDIDFRADLQRVMQWIPNTQQPPTWQIAGMTTGKVHAENTASGVSVQGSAEIENFAYAVAGGATLAQAPTRPVSQSTAWTTLWNERQLRLSLEASYAPKTDAIEVRQAAVAGGALQLQAQGNVAEASTVCRADLAGQVDYNLAQVLDRLRAWVGADVKMTGRGPRPFTLQGPLLAGGPSADGAPAMVVSPALVGKSSLAWTSAEYQGIKTGAGEAPVELSGGELILGPLDIPLAEGRLTAAPKVLLNAQPMAVMIDAGPIVQNARIAPEMCRSWLKYVAPLLADATEAEGTFSLALAQPAKIVLEDPTRTEVRGAMTIHQAQVGPGPLSRQFLALADQVKAMIERQPLAAVSSGSTVWLQVPEQSLPFEMAGGRVYHRDLKMSSKDVVIRTRGSVGLDQTLDLLAEVPLQDRWVEKEPVLASLRGQTLQIPVGGALTSPRLDRGAVEQLGRQMVGNAAQQLIEKNLNVNPDVKNTLKRLFGGGQ
jgi:hypothetical protein